MRLGNLTQWVLVALCWEAWPLLQVDKRSRLEGRVIVERSGPSYRFAAHGVSLQPVNFRSPSSGILPFTYGILIWTS